MTSMHFGTSSHFHIAVWQQVHCLACWLSKKYLFLLSIWHDHSSACFHVCQGKIRLIFQTHFFIPSMTFYASHPFVPFSHGGELFPTYIIPVAKLFCTYDCLCHPSLEVTALHYPFRDGLERNMCHFEDALRCEAIIFSALFFSK